MIETITFNNISYPKFQSDWFAAKFVFPFAKEICKGDGWDIGCGKKEWAFPGSIPVDINFDDGKYHALNLPSLDFGDYIFSSHCLEHIENWTKALDYWYLKLKSGGNIFLYLPDFSQEYWRPWNNKKHIHIFTPEIIKSYFNNNKWKNIFVSGIDLNNSFIIIAEKI